MLHRCSALRNQHRSQKLLILVAKVHKLSHLWLLSSLLQRNLVQETQLLICFLRSSTISVGSTTAALSSVYSTEKSTPESAVTQDSEFTVKTVEESVTTDSLVSSSVTEKETFSQSTSETFSKSSVSATASSLFSTEKPTALPTTKHVSDKSYQTSVPTVSSEKSPSTAGTLVSTISPKSEVTEAVQSSTFHTSDTASKTTMLLSTFQPDIRSESASKATASSTGPLLHSEETSVFPTVSVTTDETTKPAHTMDTTEGFSIASAGTVSSSASSVMSSTLTDDISRQTTMVESLPTVSRSTLFPEGTSFLSSTMAEGSGDSTDDLTKESLLTAITTPGMVTTRPVGVTTGATTPSIAKVTTSETVTSLHSAVTHASSLFSTEKPTSFSETTDTSSQSGQTEPSVASVFTSSEEFGSGDTITDMFSESSTISVGSTTAALSSVYSTEKSTPESAVTQDSEFTVKTVEESVTTDSLVSSSITEKETFSQSTSETFSKSSVSATASSLFSTEKPTALPTTKHVSDKSYQTSVPTVSSEKSPSTAGTLVSTISPKSEVTEAVQSSTFHTSDTASKTTMLLSTFQPDIRSESASKVTASSTGPLLHSEETSVFPTVSVTTDETTKPAHTMDTTEGFSIASAGTVSSSASSVMSSTLTDDISRQTTMVESLPTVSRSTLFPEGTSFLSSTMAEGSGDSTDDLTKESLLTAITTPGMVTTRPVGVTTGATTPSIAKITTSETVTSLHSAVTHASSLFSTEKPTSFSETTDTSSQSGQTEPSVASIFTSSEEFGSGDTITDMFSESSTISVGSTTAALSSVYSTEKSTPESAVTQESELTVKTVEESVTTDSLVSSSVTEKETFSQSTSETFSKSSVSTTASSLFSTEKPTALPTTKHVSDKSYQTSVPTVSSEKSPSTAGTLVSTISPKSEVTEAVQSSTFHTSDTASKTTMLLSTFQPDIRSESASKVTASSTGPLLHSEETSVFPTVSVTTDETTKPAHTMDTTEGFSIASAGTVSSSASSVMSSTLTDDISRQTTMVESLPTVSRSTLFPEGTSFLSSTMAEGSGDSTDDLTKESLLTATTTPGMVTTRPVGVTTGATTPSIAKVTTSETVTSLHSAVTHASSLFSTEKPTSFSETTDTSSQSGQTEPSVASIFTSSEEFGSGDTITDMFSESSTISVGSTTAALSSVYSTEKSTPESAVTQESEFTVKTVEESVTTDSLVSSSVTEKETFSQSTSETFSKSSVSATASSLFSTEKPTALPTTKHVSDKSYQTSVPTVSSEKSPSTAGTLVSTISPKSEVTEAVQSSTFHTSDTASKTTMLLSTFQPDIRSESASQATASSTGPLLHSEETSVFPTVSVTTDETTKPAHTMDTTEGFSIASAGTVSSSASSVMSSTLTDDISRQTTMVESLPTVSRSTLFPEGTSFLSSTMAEGSGDSTDDLTKESLLTAITTPGMVTTRPVGVTTGATTPSIAKITTSETVTSLHSAVTHASSLFSTEKPTSFSETTDTSSQSGQTEPSVASIFTSSEEFGSGDTITDMFSESSTISVGSTTAALSSVYSTEKSTPESAVTQESELTVKTVEESVTTDSLVSSSVTEKETFSQSTSETFSKSSVSTTASSLFSTEKPTALPTTKHVSDKSYQTSVPTVSSEKSPSTAGTLVSTISPKSEVTEAVQSSTFHTSDTASKTTMLLSTFQPDIRSESASKVTASSTGPLLHSEETSVFPTVSVTTDETTKPAHTMDTTEGFSIASAGTVSSSASSVMSSTLTDDISRQTTMVESLPTVSRSTLFPEGMSFLSSTMAEGSGDSTDDLTKESLLTATYNSRHGHN
ncbi:hypothetical protein NL108_010442 [Boleophthalmus pectinirostris]|nr:hypothetical protein NL108_010442 [Boleophthalmus pectinirostris]